MTHDESETFESPHRIAPATWSGIVEELGADKGAKTSRARGRGARPGATPNLATPFTQQGTRSAWALALAAVGRLGRDLGDGKHAILCINDAQHSQPPPDGTAENASGSCVLLPPEAGSIFGLPKCAHSHCASLTLRQWIAAVGYTTWEEAMVQARGWKREREYLLHGQGISGWKRIPFELRDGDDTVAGGPQQIVPDESEEYCDFPVRIVADIEEHDVGASRRWCEIEATVSGELRRVRIPATEYASLGWVAQLGLDAIVMPRRDAQQRLRAAIQFLSRPIPRREVYTFVGWRTIAGKPVYLHAEGALGAEGPVPGVEVNLVGDVLPRFALPSPPTGKALKQAVQACAALFRLTVPEVAIPLFGAVWRAPLGASPLSIYLNAPPTTGKSMLAALAQQHYGAGMNEQALPASVKNSTAASINLLRAIVGDAVFVLDDFVVSGTAEDLKLSEKIDTVVRAQYGGTGAQRLSRDGSLATAGTPPRSTLILTGETVPRGHSLRSRLLVIDLPGPISENLDAVKSAGSSGVYASAMSAYLQWLAPRLDEIRRGLRAEVMALATRIRAQAREVERDHRTSLLLAEIQIGVKYFLTFAVETGAMVGGDAEFLRQLAWVTLQAMATEQQAHRATQDPVVRFCELLASALSAGRAHVSIDDGTAPENATAWGWRVASSSVTFNESEGTEQTPPIDTVGIPSAPPEKPPRRLVYRGMGDCLGVVHTAEGVLWIKPEIALRVTRELAAEIGDPLPLSLEDLPRRLYERGLLVKTDLKGCRSYTTRGPKEAGFKRGYLQLSTRALGLEGPPGEGAAVSNGPVADSSAVSGNP